MITLQPINAATLQFDHIIATGGIGSGIFFSMEGNHTLGRNESRMATLLPYQDFCKQHIILHYISVLLGAQINGAFQSFPIGKVGNEETGKNLVQKMQAAGMDTKHVTIAKDCSTLFSVCFQYPDHTGGNITTANSASSNVLPEDITSFFQECNLNANKEIILSVPEVPLASRLKLLEYGRQRKSFNIASILSSEVDDFKKMHGFEMVDLLAINIDEASSIAKMNDEAIENKTIIEACIETLTAINPTLSIIITDGPKGSYCYKNNCLEFTPVLNVPVVSTAGAGDTFLAGIIAGLCCGLPLIKGGSDIYFSASPLQSAVELGTLLASLSVTSPDTIHSTANAELLYKFAEAHGVNFSAEFLEIFQNCIGQNK